MRRNTLQALIACVAVAGAIACNDNGLGPDAARRTVRPTSSADDFETQITGYDKHTSFDISPDGGEYVVGPFTLSIPANAVCDLSSSYGPEHWNDDCAPAGEAVHVRA